MPKNEEIILRSEEVQEILSRIPHWTIRWGNLLILIIILIIFVFSWIIKYPDIITAPITITTIIPPEKIIAKSTGRIEKIFVSNRSFVDKENPLAVIENSANYEDVFYLKSIIDEIKINENDFLFPIEKISILNLGSVEIAYSVFEKDYLAYRQNIDLKPHLIDFDAQNFETIAQNQRKILLLEQREITKKELQLKKQELQRFELLFDKGVISTQEWEQKNVELLQQEKNINSLNSQISQLSTSLNDLTRNKKKTSINKSKDDLTLKRNVILSFNQLKKVISEWDMNYILRSSISGQVSFMQIWAENQTLNTGDNTFVVIPQTKSDYVGKIKAPQLNSGKIKIGQEVNIRLDNYPYTEFGIIKGTIKSISLAPDKENNLLIDVKLTNNLETSYHKEIIFQNEMTGSADIVTEDYRLIERILYQFKGLFQRN